MFLGELLGTMLLASGRGGEACAPADTLREFTGRVEEVESLGRGELPPEAIRTHRDARWLVTIRLVKLTCTTPGVLVPPRMLYAVHSVAKTFKLPGRAAVGKTFLFVERRLKDASSQTQMSHLEVHPPRPFEAVPGWRRLRWGMSDAEVREAFGRMRLAFTEEEMRGMFEKPA